MSPRYGFNCNSYNLTCELENKSSTGVSSSQSEGKMAATIRSQRVPHTGHLFNTGTPQLTVTPGDSQLIGSSG